MDIIEFCELALDMKLQFWQKEYIKRLYGICKDRSEDEWRYVIRTIARRSSKEHVAAMYAYLVGMYHHKWHWNNKRRKLGLPVIRQKMIDKIRRIKR